jgi:hypothetical protein
VGKHGEVEKMSPLEQDSFLSIFKNNVEEMLTSLLSTKE